MKRANLTTIKKWAAPLAWMLLIFTLSTDLFSSENTSELLTPLLAALFPAMTRGQLELLHMALRKLGHLSEYFILAGLLMRALSDQFAQQPRTIRFCYALLAAMLYATSDEWHQAFVPSRTASIADVMIDSCGAFFGVLWFDRRQRKAATQQFADELPKDGFNPR